MYISMHISEMAYTDTETMEQDGQYSYQVSK